MIHQPSPVLSVLLGMQDLPGHGDGLAAVDDADRQDREAVAQAGRIHAKASRSTASPGGSRPAGGETGGDVELVALLARLGGGRLVSRAGVLFPCYSVWSRNTTHLNIYLLRCVYVLEFN